MKYSIQSMIAAMAFCASVALAVADDLPFGGDLLRHLSREADTVIRALEPRRLASDAPGDADPSKARYVLYAIKVDSVFKGTAEAGKEIRLAVPEGFDLRQVDQLTNSMLFLRRLSNVELHQNKLTSGENTYLLVSGRYGAVDAGVAGRQQAVQAYIDGVRPDAARGERVLTWTEQFINSSDPFLQRSAVTDLYYERSNPRAVDQLKNALRSDAIVPAAKKTAIDALQLSGAPDAIPVLKDFAEDKKAQSFLRVDAIKAFKNLPGGTDQLKQWSASGDQLLSTTADKVINAKQ